MITVGSYVIWRDPYWSDLSIEGKVIEDLGNKAVSYTHLKLPTTPYV